MSLDGYIIIWFSLCSTVDPYNASVLGDNVYSQGEQLQLNCSSEGGPILEYNWLFLGNIIPNANTSTLTIDNVNTTHAGDYTCSVTNDAGTDSDTITVYGKSLLPGPNLIIVTVSPDQPSWHKNLN